MAVVQYDRFPATLSQKPIVFFVTDKLGKISANGVAPLNWAFSWVLQLLISVEEEDIQPMYRITKKGEVIQTLTLKQQYVPQLLT